jgi:hypothetical protein
MRLLQPGNRQYLGLHVVQHYLSAAFSMVYCFGVALQTYVLLLINGVYIFYMINNY